jgi:hypothetical protein
MRQAVVYARTLMEDSKILFESIIPKSNISTSRVSSGRDKAKNKEARE